MAAKSAENNVNWRGKASGIAQRWRAGNGAWQPGGMKALANGVMAKIAWRMENGANQKRQ